MKTLILCFLTLILGMTLGYTWAFKAYQPLKMQEQIEELELDLKLLNKAYVRDISRHFLDGKHEVRR